MHTTSQLYKDLLQLPSVVECKLVIAGETYTEAELVSVNVAGQAFGVEAPSAGNTVSRMITVEMLDPGAAIPARAKMELFARLRHGKQVSEWLPKGVFYVDTRSIGESAGGFKTTIILEGYDAMIKGEQDYKPTGEDWPHTSEAVLAELCALIGVESDFTPESSYSIEKPKEYSVREVLGYISAMYGGSFVINDAGRLQLLELNAGAEAPAPAQISSLTVGDRLQPFSKVRLHKMDGTVYEVGSNTGRALNVDCPWATQTMAGNILNVVSGYEYQPFTAVETLIDPACELGDRININGNLERIYHQNITYGKGLYSILGAMEENEINHDYPYMSSVARGAFRAAASARSEVNRVEKSLTADVRNVHAGLNAIASDYQLSHWQEAGTSLFAELVDEHGHIKGAWINETVISDGTNAKSLIDMLADIITLNGKIVVVGDMHITDGILVVDRSMRAERVSIKNLYVNSPGTAEYYQYTPKQITSSSGETFLALAN